tara:strand:- start:939 stop:1454 length:516 start_codon:yes stop_codon:yes gene_type:complete
MGKAADLGIDVDMKDFERLARVLAQVENIDKDKALKKILQKVALSPVRKDAKRRAPSPGGGARGELKKAINSSKPMHKLNKQIVGMVGVAIGKPKNPRFNLAAIMEFGRKSFFSRITGFNGRKYSVRIGSTQPGHYLLGALEKEGKHIPVNFAKEMARLVKKKIKMGIGGR